MSGPGKGRIRLTVLALAVFLPLVATGTASAQDTTTRAGVPAPEAAAVTAATPPGIVCARPRDGKGNYTGTARCPVRSAAWTYYQAYLTYFDDCSQFQRTTSTIRMQVLARRGATGVHIGGIWVVFLQGHKRFGSMGFTAIDANGREHREPWNYLGRFSTDIADLYSNGTDPIRYPLTPGNFAGLPTTSSRDPYFFGQFAMSDGAAPYLQAQCRLIPLSVVFTK